MAIQFNCIGCGHVFRVGDEMAGRKGKCPKCAVINQIPLADGSMPPAPAPAPAPVPAPTRQPAQGLRKQPAAPVPAPVQAEVEEEVIGDAVAEEASPEVPAGGKKKRSLMLPALIGGGVLLLSSCCLCTGIGAWYYFSNGSLDDRKYLPTDTQMVFSIRVEQGMDSDVIKQARKEKIDPDPFDDKGTTATYGLPLSNIDRITVAGSLSDAKPVTIIRTRKSVKAADLKGAMDKRKFEDVPFLSYTINEITEGGPPSKSFCVVESSVVVFADVRTLKYILDRGKEPELSPSMQTALKNADFGATVAFAMDVKAVQTRAERKKDEANELKGVTMMLGKDAEQAQKALAKVEALSGSVSLKSSATINLTAACKDSAGAEEVKKVLDSALAKLKELGDAFPPVKDAINEVTSNTKISQSGSSATVKATLKGDIVAKSVPMMTTMMGGMGGKPSGPAVGGDKKQIQESLKFLKSQKEAMEKAKARERGDQGHFRPDQDAGGSTQVERKRARFRTSRI